MNEMIKQQLEAKLNEFYEKSKSMSITEEDRNYYWEQYQKSLKLLQQVIEKEEPKKTDKRAIFDICIKAVEIIGMPIVLQIMAQKFARKERIAITEFEKTGVYTYTPSKTLIKRIYDGIFK